MGKYFQKLSGEEYETVYNFPSTEDTLRKMWIKSAYPPRLLGAGKSAWVFVSEEQRTHTHIIGTTRVGKSKFLEHLIREDIDKGHGVCFVDSSEAGQTAYNILRYCAHIGHNKVIFIDPLHTHLFKKIAPINVFGDFPDESAEKVLDIVQIQFLQTDMATTPVIKQYLPAIIRLLHQAEMTLAEALYFTNPAYRTQREEIFKKASRLQDDVLMLRAAFENRDLYREYRPTARRILDVLHPTLKLYFGSKKGLDFTRLIADKWVIIVNLYPQKDFGKFPARFLGTAIINELISSMDSLTGNALRDNQWKGRFYLYIDEVGRYANRNIADVFSYKGKTGMILTVAHQNLGQIEDPYVRDVILNQTSTKVIFRVESEDTHRIARMIYGGEIPDREAAYYINRLPKQHCIIKLPAQDSQSVMVPTVDDDFKVNIKSYLEEVYSQDCYIPIEEIEQEQDSRINKAVYYETKVSYENPRPPGTSHSSPKKTSKTAHRPNSKVTAPNRAVGDSGERGHSFHRLRQDEITYPTDKEKK